MLVVGLVLSCLTWAETTMARNAPPAETAALMADQTLEDLAKQLYDDPRAADEIRAVNEMAPDVQPRPGERFKLPGRQRQPAVSALGVAAQAVRDARLQGAAEYAAERLDKAVESLERARQACRSAEYAACQELADETWALARLARKETRALRSRKNRFIVSVDPEGTTRVEVMEGDGVEVSAQKKNTVVRRGHAVRVRTGMAPERARRLLDPPEPVLPFLRSRLVTSSIQFHWKPVQGAARYVLLISRDPAGRRPVRQLTIEDTSYLFRSSLADGEYFWFLRTVDAHGLVGRASAARFFTLSTSAGGGVTVEPSRGADTGKGP